MLSRFLSEKSMIGVDVDSPDRLYIHKQILNKKSILKKVFYEFHHQMITMDKSFFGDTEGLKVELGAGVCPVKESYPDVLASDIVAGEGLDCVLDAQSMDLADNSVRAVFGQNCFHHFPQPEKFFSELCRVLVPGGGAILIEPYYGPFASVLYKHLFSSEDFDKSSPVWDVSAEGPMKGANQALSYIVFVRDVEEFNKKYPQLEVVLKKPLTNYLRYFLSGGLNFRSLVPKFMEKPIKFIEWILSPLAGIFALHYIIVIRRKPE